MSNLNHHCQMDDGGGGGGYSSMSLNMAETEKKQNFNEINGTDDYSGDGGGNDDESEVSVEIFDGSKSPSPFQSKTLVIVKEETVDGGGDGGADGGFGGGFGSCSSSSWNGGFLPKPTKKLLEFGPQFLTKTFQMVEDPETDSIICWSNTFDSFIVKDEHDFSRTLLPKYFKHNNFSTFHRQLNTYGFRKINSDRLEFANESFLKGNKHLLKNIKRRSKPEKLLLGGTRCIDLAKPELETEFRMLKNDQETLRNEILGMKRKQESSEGQIASIEDRIRCAESKQHQIGIFLTKAAGNGNFLQQIMQKRKQKLEIENAEELNKKSRLIAENLSRISGFDLQPTIKSEMNEKSSIAMWDEKGTNNHVLVENYSKIYLELEDLIDQPQEWECCATALIEHTACTGSRP